MVGVGTAITIASAAFNKAKEGFDLRATLEEQRRTVGTLLGDIQKGNQVFTDAAEFGRRYGFTQREMGESAAAAAPLIRTSTTAVEKQLEVLGRLASLNTAEGFKGAVFSTKELASGDITSIVERFNLSRDAANEMKAAIAGGADVFQVLDQQLNKMGVTAEVLSNRMLGAAGASRTYAQSQEDLGLALGNLAAGPGVKALDFLTNYTNTLTGILSKGDAFAGAASGADAIQAKLVSFATSYEDYATRIGAANQQMRDEIGKTDPLFAALVGSIETLTPAQFAYAQSLIATGTAQGDAVAKATALADVSRELSMIQDTAAVTNQAAAAGIEELSAQILQAASVSPEAADGVLNMAAAVASNQLSVENFRAALEGLIRHQQLAGEMAAYDAIENQRLTQVHVDAALAAQNSAAQSLIDAQAKAEQTAKTELLRLQTQAAVEEFLRLNPTLSATQVAAVGAANGLSPLQIQLAQTALRAAEAQSALSAFQRQAALGTGIGGLTPLRGLKERGPVGGALGQGAGGSSAGQAFRQRALINSYYPTYEAPKPARGGGGGGGASVGSKLDNARITEMQKTEDAEREHQQRLLDIEKDFSDKAAQQARKNEVSKRKSRADFYDNLTSATEDIGGEAAQKLAADYEAAYAEAQKIAQSGNHKLAADYLEMKQEQVNAEVEYQQRVARAREEGNTAEVARLEAIQAMRRDANQEELKQLTEGGDSIVNEREAALQAEGQKYEEQTAKIETAAQRKEDALVRSSANSAGAVQAWADQVEDATRRATNALNSVPKVPVVGAPGEEGVEEGGTPTPTGQGLAGRGRTLSGGARAAGSGSSGAVAVLSEANAILEQIVALGNVHKKYIKPIQLYQQTLGTAVELLTTVADFHGAAQAAVVAPLEVGTIQRLVDEARAVLDLTVTKLVPFNERQVTIFENYNKAVGGSIGILSDMADLRVTISDALRDSSPFDMVAVNWLVRRAAEFTALVQSSLLPLTEKQAAAMDRYASGVGASVSIIGDLASLRQTVTDAIKNSQPFDSAQIAFLVGRAKEFTSIVQRQLIPLSEDQAAGMERYASGVGAAVSIIGGLAGLRQQVTEAMKESQPFDSAQIAFLVGRAKEFTALVRSQLLPLTQEQSDELTRYADAVSASVQIIADMAGLREETTGISSPIDEATLQRLASEAQRIARIVQGTLLPVGEEQASALQRYADAVSAGVTALKAPLELSAQLFADYQSPSDAQLNLLAADAKRVADRMTAAAATYSTEGLEAGKSYAEGVGATFGAFNEALVFFDRLRFTDLAIDPQQLATFENSTMQTLSTMERIGTRAAQIPAANIAAVQSSAAAMTAQMDALLRMTAIPWGDVPAAAAGYAASGGVAAGGGITVNIYNPPATMDVGAVTRQVTDAINQQMRGYR